MFEGTRALVVGLGASGAAAAEALLAEGAAVRISEQRHEAAVDRVRWEALGAHVEAGGHREAHLDGVDLVVLSPGVPEHAPVVRWANERRLETISELELGARLAGAVPYLAVTGTNGKTTTTDMIAAMMRASGMDAVACGNIGHPFTRAVQEDHEMLVVEASSFQLRFTETFHPRISVLLNIAPDHLDWHGSMQAYADAKARIFEHQVAPDLHIGNADDASREVSARAPCDQLWFRSGAPGEGEVGYADGRLAIHMGSNRTLEVPEPVHPGLREDVAAAACGATAFGIEDDVIEDAIARFEPGGHRGQVVATVAGVAFVDDSKATNPAAVLAALAGRSGVVLIAGGLAKGSDLTPLTEAVDALVGVVAMGASAGQVEDLFSGIRPVRRAESIEQAAELALELARSSVPPGGSVVLAPGGASQDQFVDYRERGERFAEAARELARAHGEASPDG